MKLFLITELAFFVLLPELLSGLPKCNWSDSNLTACFVDLFELVRPFLKTGFPDLVPSLEPFVVDQIPFQASLLGMILQGEVRNVEVRGGSDIEIANVSVDAIRKTADVTVIIPKLEVTADYTFESRHLFNVHSAGRFEGTFYDINVDVQATGSFDDDNDRKHLIISNTNVLVRFGKRSTFHLEITKGGIAAKIGTALANMAPKRLVLSMLSSLINSLVGEMLKKYLNLILDKLPIELINTVLDIKSIGIL